LTVVGANVVVVVGATVVVVVSARAADSGSADVLRARAPRATRATTDLDHFGRGANIRAFLL